MAANIPAYSRAILLDTQYFNNNGQAQIKDHAGEAILICFTNDEEYIRVSAQVTHQNVDGSRPTMGISAFIDENIVFLK